jgi:hypothetical protein
MGAGPVYHRSSARLKVLNPSDHPPTASKSPFSMTFSATAPTNENAEVAMRSEEGILMQRT